MSKPKIVIWGADNYNTLGVLRSLSVADLDILLLINGSKQGVATASKYCTKYFAAHSIGEAVKYMVENYPEQNNPEDRAVLIPGGDGASLGAAENYGLLVKRFHLMTTADPRTLINVTDKLVMGQVAEEAGLLTPKTQVYSIEDCEVEVPFPIILKPLHSTGRVEFKTKQLNDIKELESFKKYLNPNNRYLLQQYIKKEFDVVIYGCRLPDGALVLAGHHTLERWSDDGGGSYGHLSPEIPGYIDVNALTRFFEIIDYKGEFSAEYGYVDGKAYFYEVNLRNDGFCHLSFQAGANLPLLWVQACLGMPLTASPKMTKSVVGINEVYDVINVWRRNISWIRYKKDLREAEAFHFYDAEDKKPYKNMHKRMYWEIPFRAILKSYRPLIVKVINKLGL